MPVPKWDGYARFCSLARGLDVVGERWSLVIVQELLHSGRRYSELRLLLPGIGSNVLSDRLRSLEAREVIERVASGVGEGVHYTLTARGRALGPALALFRQWGLDELLPPPGSAVPLPLRHDVSYAIPDDLALHEAYKWTVDGVDYGLHISGQILSVERNTPRRPVVSLATTRDFLHRWVCGTESWDSGRASGEVTVKGTDIAWTRMLLATGYPGRAPDTAERVRKSLAAHPRRTFQQRGG